MCLVLGEQKLFLHLLLLCSDILTYQCLTELSAPRKVKSNRVLAAKTNYPAQLHGCDRLTETNKIITEKTST